MFNTVLDMSERQFFSKAEFRGGNVKDRTSKFKSSVFVEEGRIKYKYGRSP